MLGSEVISAIENDKFKIWAVDHIEDGIRILTGKIAGIEHKDGSFTKDSVFENVRERLIDFARKSKTFTKNLTSEAKKEEKNDDEES